MITNVENIGIGGDTIADMPISATCYVGSGYGGQEAGHTIVSLGCENYKTLRLGSINFYFTNVHNALLEIKGDGVVLYRNTSLGSYAINRDLDISSYSNISFLLQFRHGRENNMNLSGSGFFK